MSDYRVVSFTNPDEFLEATSKYDDSWMNFAIGALMDGLDASQTGSQTPWGLQESTLIAMYCGDEIFVTLTKIAKDFSWVLSQPQDTSIPTENIPHVCQFLAKSLPSILSSTNPPSISDLLRLDKVIGPEFLVDAFLSIWAAHVTSLNLSNLDNCNTPLRLEPMDPPYFRSRVSYATLDTIPPDSVAFSPRRPYAIARASNDEDALALAPLYVEFTAHGPSSSTLEEGLTVMKDAVHGKRIWYCRSNGSSVGGGDLGNPNATLAGSLNAIAGYVMVGRETPRTIAIRNVYVSPAHRRQGIAEAMVRAVTRYYLGAHPLRFDVDGVEKRRERKEEICLNVADIGARRLYARCGFLLGDDARDPKTGRLGSSASIWRGVKVVKL